MNPQREDRGVGGLGDVRARPVSQRCSVSRAGPGRCWMVAGSASGARGGQALLVRRPRGSTVVGAVPSVPVSTSAPVRSSGWSGAPALCR